MSQAYVNNIMIGNLILELNPEQYSPNFIKLGSFKRTIAGNFINSNINGKRLSIQITGIAQSQVEEIKKITTLNQFVNFIDFVPISETGAKTRSSYEDIGEETILGEVIYTYIPIYRILIMDYEQTYAYNRVEYKIIGQEN